MKAAILSGLLLGALHAVSLPSAEAHNKDRVKFSCDADGCKVVTVMHGHTHKHAHKTKIRFKGDVCVYKPWNNVTVCRY